MHEHRLDEETDTYFDESKSKRKHIELENRREYQLEHHSNQKNLQQQEHHQRHANDDDSMRRHEIDRGSEIEYEKRSTVKRNSTEQGGHEEEDDGQVNNRDQLYIKDGNAEILQLITRGKHEDENVYVNIPPQPQYIMVDNGGKEILMRRFIEEQANGKHIIREHYQIIPDISQTMVHHQPIPNEVQQFQSMQVPVTNEAYANKSQVGSAIYSNVDPRRQDHGTNILTDVQLQHANSNQSLIQQELENSLKQQNALLRQILLEKEKLEEKYSTVEIQMETQSLPGHSLAIATQTDCEAGTQTEPYNIKPAPRRARSENDDSMSENDYEMVQYSPSNSPEEVYWIKRKRPKRKSRKLSEKHVRRGQRVVMVAEMKRKIRTPIKEESEDAHVQTPPKRHVAETKTSVLRRKKHDNEKATPRKSAGLRKEVLMEISDSLDEERPSPVERRRNVQKVHVKQVEYYEESEDDDSDNDIVIRRRTYSADSLDNYSGASDGPETPHRSVSRFSKRQPVKRKVDASEQVVSYRKKDERQRTESVTSIPILRRSRKDRGTEAKPRRQATSEPPNRTSVKGPAPKPPAADHIRSSKKVPSKAHSEADIGRKMSEDSHDSTRSVPKYMEWYYNKNKEEADRSDDFKIEKTRVSNKKQVGAIEKRIKAKAPKHGGSQEDLARLKAEGGARMLREDVQMNKTLAPKIQTDTNHPRLQYSEHRYEHEYDPAPDIPVAPTKLPHYMYPETPPQAKPQKNSKLMHTQQKPKPSPIREHEVKDFKVIIPIESSTDPPHHQTQTTKQLNVSTLEDDHDSGIAMNSLLHNMGRRNPIADKKSVFTIAYDDVKVKKIQSESDSPQFS